MGRAVSAAAARHLLNGLDALVHQVGHSLLLLLKFGQNVALVAASLGACFLWKGAGAHLLRTQRLVFCNGLLCRCHGHKA